MRLRLVDGQGVHRHTVQQTQFLNKAERSASPKPHLFDSPKVFKVLETRKPPPLTRSHGSRGIRKVKTFVANSQYTYISREAMELWNATPAFPPSNAELSKVGRLWIR